MSVIRCFNRKCPYWSAEEPDRCTHPIRRLLECPDADVRKDENPAGNHYLKDLRSNECQCGRSKKPGRSFCYNCWSDLPGEIQRRLYARMGAGYEEAYDEACRFLE